MAVGSEGVPCGSYSAPQSTLFGPTSMYEASSRTTRTTHEKTRPKRTAGDMFKRRSTFGVGTLESLFRLSSLYLSAATHTQVRRTQHEHCRRSHLTATSTPPHPFFRCEKYENSCGRGLFREMVLRNAVGVGREVLLLLGTGQRGVSLRGPSAHACDSEERERGRWSGGSSEVLEMLPAVSFGRAFSCVICVVPDDASFTPVGLPFGPNEGGRFRELSSRLQGTPSEPAATTR